RPAPRSCTTPACAPTTTNSAPARSATTPPSARSATASSGSSTDASRPITPTARQPPGHTGHNPPQLDISAPGVSDTCDDGTNQEEEPVPTPHLPLRQLRRVRWAVRGTLVLGVAASV